MDINILLWFQSIRNPVLDALMQGITMFGEEMLLIALICLCYWCVDKRMAQFAMFNFFLSGMTTQLLKISAMQLRPWVRDARVAPVPSAMHAASGYSFPSGHTTSATAAYGSASVYRRQKALGWACAALIALVGISRLYLGVHAPQDVLMGWAVGALMLLVTRRLFAWAENTPGAAGRVLAVGLVICAAAGAFALLRRGSEGDGKLVLDMFKSAGAASGMLIGWFWEQRSIRFDARAPMRWQLAKYAVGIALLVAIMAVPWPFSWMPDKLAAVSRYLLLAFTAVALWPWAFQRVLGRILS